MPTGKIGDPNALDNKGLFISLKDKDEKHTFRFLRPDYTYDGKHFEQGADGKWTVTDCPRINEGNPCELCQKAMDIKKALKNTDDENEKKKIRETARPYEPKVTFYYVVLDRETGFCKILKTTLSVRLKLEEKLNDGEDIYHSDYVLKRTEKPGSEYYTLTRVDSKDTKPFTEEEEKEVEKCLEWDLEDLTLGTKSEFEVNPEVAEQILK